MGSLSELSIDPSGWNPKFLSTYFREYVNAPCGRSLLKKSVRLQPGQEEVPLNVHKDM